MLSSRDFFDNFTDILNLSAPGAAKLLNPFALSYKESSSVAATTSSRTSNPTLYDGVLVYGSRTISDVGTSTNTPLIKYTPLLTPNADPVADASSETQVRIVSLVFNVVLPYVKGSSRINTSSLGKPTLSPSVPD